MKHPCALILVLMLTVSVIASSQTIIPRHLNQPPNEVNLQWHSLLEAKKLAEAETFCQACLRNPDQRIIVEGHKCLANVSIARASPVVEGPRAGRSGSIGQGLAGPGVDDALKHLKQALALAPGDMTIHQGRLYLLLRASRYDEMPGALEESIGEYKKPDALEHWLSYCGVLLQISHAETGLAFTRVLEKYYPTDHRVIANVGGFLMALERDAEALEYLKKAIVMKPDDPINNWNLGRLYDFTNQNQLADQYYQQALKLEQKPDQLKVNYCIYAGFLEKKLLHPARACELQQQYCPVKERTACYSKKGEQP